MCTKSRIPTVIINVGKIDVTIVMEQPASPAMPSVIRIATVTTTIPETPKPIDET